MTQMASCSRANLLVPSARRHRAGVWARSMSSIRTHMLVEAWVSRRLRTSRSTGVSQRTRRRTRSASARTFQSLQDGRLVSRLVTTRCASCSTSASERSAERTGGSRVPGWPENVPGAACGRPTTSAKGVGPATSAARCLHSWVRSPRDRWRLSDRVAAHAFASASQ